MKSVAGNFSFVTYNINDIYSIVCFMFKPYENGKTITYYTKPESKIFDIDDFDYNSAKTLYETKRKLRFGELYKIYLGTYKGIYIPEQLCFVFSTNLFTGKWKLSKERENTTTYRIIRQV